MNKGLTEAQVQAQIIAYLNMKHILFWRQNTGSFKIDDRYIRAGVKGVSDIIGCLPNGQFLAIEVKREKGGRVSKEQENFLINVSNNNGVAMIASSFESFKLQFDEIMQEITRQ